MINEEYTNAQHDNLSSYIDECADEISKAKGDGSLAVFEFINFSPLLNACYWIYRDKLYGDSPQLYFSFGSTNVTNETIVNKTVSLPVWAMPLDEAELSLDMRGSGTVNITLKPVDGKCNIKIKANNAMGSVFKLAWGYRRYR